MLCTYKLCATKGMVFYHIIASYVATRYSYIYMHTKSSFFEDKKQCKTYWKVLKLTKYRQWKWGASEVPFILKSSIGFNFYHRKIFLLAN